MFCEDTPGHTCKLIEQPQPCSCTPSCTFHAQHTRRQQQLCTPASLGLTGSFWDLSTLHLCFHACLQWFNLLWSFISGAATAMDTLVSQAYGEQAVQRSPHTHVPCTQFECLRARRDQRSSLANACMPLAMPMPMHGFRCGPCVPWSLPMRRAGGKDYRSLLVWTYTAVVVMSVYCIPICVSLRVEESQHIRSGSLCMRECASVSVHACVCARVCTALA